jgi:hypothetical protein
LQQTNGELEAQLGSWGDGALSNLSCKENLESVALLRQT